MWGAISSVTSTYDTNGNLTYDGTFTYCYDTENRLTSVLSAGTCAAPTTTVATYAYDAQGRRKSKTVSGTTTIFVTDADNREVVEYDGSTGAVANWYAYGLGPNEVLNQTNGAGTTRATLIPDIQGSFIGSLSSAGTLTKAGYRPYGESASTSGSFRYTGQRIDPETNGLYYYRARMYAPAWGRFMQADPVGYAGGNNLYAYVGNDPLNFIDPDGQCVPWCVTGAIGAAVGIGVELLTNKNASWGSVAIAAGGGFIAGATGSGAVALVARGFSLAGLTGAGASATSEIVGAGLASTLGNVVSQAANVAAGNQSDISAAGVALSFIAGAGASYVRAGVAAVGGTQAVEASAAAKYTLEATTDIKAGLLYLGASSLGTGNSPNGSTPIDGRSIELPTGSAEGYWK